MRYNKHREGKGFFFSGGGSANPWEAGLRKLGRLGYGAFKDLF